MGSPRGLVTAYIYPDDFCGLLSFVLQSSQSLWNRLSVLLNLLPSAADLQESGRGEGKGNAVFQQASVVFPCFQ